MKFINNTILLLISIITSQLFAQNYNFRNFSIKEGLLDAIVTSTVQTQDGFLYFTTQSGLSKFDGKKTQNFNKNNGLPHNNIEFALEYKPNKLLLATFGGLSIFDGEHFKNFTTLDGLTNDTLYTIFKDKNRFLLGTKNGISIFSNNLIANNSEFDYFRGMKIYAFEYGVDNSLFIGTNKGLYRIADNKITCINDKINTFDLELNSDSTMWCGSVDGAFSYKNGTLSKDLNLKDKVVYSIKIDNNNQIWFGTLSGIVKKNKDVYTSYNNTNYFQGRECYHIFQDRELNLWFATNHGAYIFDDGKFILYDRRSGVSSSAWDIIERSNGEIWVATDGNGVLKLQGDKFSEIPMLSKLPKTIWSLFQDKSKNIWFCTSHGVSRLDTNNLLLHFSSKTGFTDDMILGISEDINGTLWFTSFSSGVYKYDGKTFQHFNLKNAGASPIFDAVRGFDGYLWFISGSGIDKIKDMKSFDFPNQDLLNQYSYYSVNIDSVNQYLLLGSYERGLIMYKPHAKEPQNVLKYISTENGLSDNSILFTKFDDNNSILWIGTNKGINKLDYNYFIKTGEIKIKSYNTYDGFPSIECNQLGAIIDSKGYFWFSTVSGIVKYDKAKENNIDFISSPLITSIEINYKNIELNKFGTRNEIVPFKYDNIEFPYYMNNITFHFSSIYFTNPLDVLFRYRLIGSNEAFSPLTKNQYVTFSSLNPGSYTFELISYTDDGSKPSLPIQFTFVIETPFWKSNLFFAFLFFAFLFGIYVVYRIRTAAIRNKNIELVKLYKENVSYQEKLVESEKDYKGLFENAHNAILLIDIDTFLIIDANNSAENLYGYERIELLNLSIKVLSVDENDAVELIKKVVQNNIIKKYKTTHIKKDGSKIILSINASITNYKGKSSIVAVHRDITEEEDTKKLLLLAKEAAEKSNKLKSEFLAQISHEIRTPINTVLGYVSLLKELLSENSDDEINSLFLPIQRSSKRIIRTIDLILNMSEVNSGTFELNIEEVEVADCLNFIIIEQQHAAKEKGLALTLTNNIGSTCLPIDEYTFTQIFVNLIDNAIKYTNNGSINVILSKGTKSVIIEIIDTGIGMSPEYIPILFDAFSQEEQGYTRKYEGNGLGLALVKNYVSINKGTISVESTKGKGTIFRVEFNT